MTRLFLPETGDTSVATMAAWYANVPREIAAGLLTEEQREYFATYYREAGLLRWWRRPFFHRHFTESFAAAARFLLGAGAEGVIIDLGCGTGTQSLFLALNGARVVGVDLDATALEIFRRRRDAYEQASGRRLDIEIHQGNVFATDFAAWGPVRGIYSMFAFNMMQPSGPLVDRLLAAMPAGGRFVVIDGNSRSLPARCLPGRRRPVWSPTRFAAEMAARGLRVDAHAGGVALPPLLWRLAPGRLAKPVDSDLCRRFFWPVSHQVMATKVGAGSPAAPAATVARRRVLMLGADEMVLTTRVVRAAETLSSRYDVLALGVWRHKLNLDREAQRAQWPFRLDWVELGGTARLPRNTAGYLLRYARVFRDTVRRGRAFAPDFIHAHEWSTLPMARLVQLATGARLIYDAHELYRDEMEGRHSLPWRVLARMETMLMAHCDAVIACNEDRARIMLEEYGAPCLPIVIPNIPVRRPHEPSNRLREMLGERAAGLTHLVLYQGMIIGERGLENLPRALSRLAPGIGLVLLGDGSEELKRQLGAIAEAGGVGERFFLLPSVPQSELHLCTSSADVGILIYRPTCRNNYYCAPNKLYEYAAAGLPMVGADLPPIRSFIESNQVGELFDPDADESLARAIGAICGDQERRRRYRANCLAAADRFNWQDCCGDVLLRLYAALTPERGR